MVKEQWQQKAFAGKLANGQSTSIVTEQSSIEGTGAVATRSAAAKLAKGRGTSIASSVTELSSGARARAVAVRSKVGIQAPKCGCCLQRAGAGHRTICKWKGRV